MHAYRDAADARRVIEGLLKVNPVRSADRANMETMLRQVKRGTALNYQQRYNLWAYVSRYESQEGISQ